ncbi:hypothetical protein [Mucilaginibacter sp. FT3.2]|nr:hypothetical protein [Mucilaginibacter sp. FT3.2]MBB6234020.1 hypothetical protein [Mucilaginibacter sp. FT3.2]
MVFTYQRATSQEACGSGDNTDNTLASPKKSFPFNIHFVTKVFFYTFAAL